MKAQRDPGDKTLCCGPCGLFFRPAETGQGEVLCRHCRKGAQPEGVDALGLPVARRLPRGTDDRRPIRRATPERAT